jgi:hypothetical protein
MTDTTSFGAKAWRTLAVPVAAGVIYVAVGTWLLRFVYLSDFFQMIWLADAQRAGISTAFANGFLGMGFPMTLNAVTLATGNILTSAKIIQALSGAAILTMLPALFENAFGDRAGARLAQGLLAIDAVFFFAACGETPDLFATAFMTGAVLAATIYIRRPSIGPALVTGVCLGLGYMVRYHSLLLLPWVVAAMAAATPAPRRRVLWAVVGFVLAASPQFIASALVQGNPLFNLHIKSVAMGYYGVSSDFVAKTQPYTLWRVLTEQPSVVAKQYAIFVIRYFTEIGGGMLLLAGAILARRGEQRAWAVLALPAIALTLLVAAKFYTDRAILFQLVVWYVVVGRALQHIAASRQGWLTTGIAVVLACAIGGSSVVEAGRTWSRMSRLEKQNGEITRALRDRGLIDSRRVFTTHLSFYLADAPGGGPFYPFDTWLLYDENYARIYPHSYFSDLSSLTGFVQAHDTRFLLLGPLTAELSPSVFARQKTGDLGPDYRLIKRWGDVLLFEYVGNRAQQAQQGLLTTASASPAR